VFYREDVQPYLSHRYLLLYLVEETQSPYDLSLQHSKEALVRTSFVTVIMIAAVTMKARSDKDAKNDTKPLQALFYLAIRLNISSSF
jgi:hypothetical protein